jgi:hypothetical protein
MNTKGYDYDDPIDAVRLPDGSVVVFDNTRVAVALELGGFKKLPMRLHRLEDRLPPPMIGRLGHQAARRRFIVETWEDALTLRTSSQNPRLPIQGTDVVPRLPPGYGQGAL